MVILNIFLGMAHFQNTPLYIGENCFYDVPLDPNTGDPLIDPAASHSDPSITGMADLTEEMSFPTNSTQTDATWGANETFNSITSQIEQGWKALETMKLFIGGGFVTSIFDNIFFCQIDNNPLTETGEVNPTYQEWVRVSNPLWDYFKTGIGILFSILLVYTVFYWVTGRGHSLTA